VHDGDGEEQPQGLLSDGAEDDDGDPTEAAVRATDGVSHPVYLRQDTIQRSTVTSLRCTTECITEGLVRGCTADLGHHHDSTVPDVQ